MEDKNRKLYGICCKWNRKKITAKEAMGKIWMLYEEEILEVWNKERD